MTRSGRRLIPIAGRGTSSLPPEIWRAVAEQVRTNPSTKNEHTDRAMADTRPTDSSGAGSSVPSLPRYLSTLFTQKIHHRLEPPRDYSFGTENPPRLLGIHERVRGSDQRI
jgi:hypothetical protein